MKKIVYTLVLAFALISSAASAQNIITENEVNIEINHNTTREQLSQMYTELNALGLVFRYNPQFDNNKKLTAIQYRISTADGVDLGTVDMTNLQNPSSSTKILLTKTEGHYTVVCLGNCN